MDITKVIIPAAGLGTRFLPFTKAVPKEMLPLINKPAIHYVVEEALQSDINQLIFITSKNKESIADYFDSSDALNAMLKERSQDQLMASINKLIRSAHFTYIRQHEPLGLGHAITMARFALSPKEYVAIMLPDDIITGPQPGLAQLMRIARQEKASVIAVQEVPDECLPAYGIVGVKKQITPNLFQVQSVIEKPSKKDAPSNLAVIGRYVLSSKIFKALEEVNEFGTQELQLTDAITHMTKLNEKVFAYKVQGTRYDVGTPLGWMKALISLGLQHPQYGPHIKAYLADLGTSQSFIYDSAKNISHTL